MPGMPAAVVISGSLKASKFNPNKQDVRDGWTRRLEYRLHDAGLISLKARVGIATLVK